MSQALIIVDAGLVIALIVFSFLAIRAARLILSAVWLACASMVLSLIFYLVGATTVAVIELSIGAGLVTVLFVFAISLAGEDAMDARPLIPKWLAWALVIASVLLLGWSVLPIKQAADAAPEPSFVVVMWQQRSLDVLVQLVLIFAGVLGMLGLLAEEKAPLEQSVADQVKAQRDRELLALRQQSLKQEKDHV